MNRHFRSACVLLLAVFAFATGAFVKGQEKTTPLAQEQTGGGPSLTLPALKMQATAEELAKNPDLFLKSAEELLHWKEPAEPAKIVGPIHFVGTKGLGSFLIKGSEGHILLYSGMPGSGELIEKSIRQLGVPLQEVKYILTGHAHTDHVGGHAHLKQATGAKIAMMREEILLFESGGLLDFQYSHSKAFAFEPAKVERPLRDEEVLTLGDISIEAHFTPGHTPGSTSYSIDVKEGGKTYNVVFVDGMGVNPGYRLSKNPSYPGIQESYERTFRKLESLKPDIWLAPHNEKYDLEGKLARSAKEGVEAWLDLEGYQKFVATQKERFLTTLKQEQEKS